MFLTPAGTVLRTRAQILADNSFISTTPGQYRGGSRATGWPVNPTGALLTPERHERGRYVSRRKWPNAPARASSQHHPRDAIPRPDVQRLCFILNGRDQPTDHQQL